MERNKRFDEISIMRVMAMLMIVAFHSMCFYNGRWIKVDAIDIPIWHKISYFLDVIDLNMFVFISGYLYGYLYIYKNKYYKRSEVIRNKAIRLLIPYCIWGIPMTIVCPWNTWKNFFGGVGHLWFLLMLFGVFTLAVILQILNDQRVKFNSKTGILLIVMVYVFSLLFTNYVYAGGFLCINKILYYFPAFLIGYVCAKLQVAWWLPGWSFILLPVALLVLFVLIWFPLPVPDSLLLLAKTLCAYVVCVTLLIILSKMTFLEWFRTIVQTIERLSMGIYIFNQIMMDLVLTTPVLHRWFEVHWMAGPFVLFLIGFFPPMLLSYIFNKYKWLEWTIGG